MIGGSDIMSKISPGVLAPPHEVLTPDEWRARGRERRSSASRSSHAQWAPPADRPDPVAVLGEQAKTRVPDLIPIRYGRMMASPFAYFRGAAAPMAWDLAHTPTSDIRVQACGDAHLLNFGMYAAPDRRLVFDVNDFDETLPAPFEWDVKRLAASFAVAARATAVSDRDARTAARLAVRSYRTEMAGYATMRFLEVWYSRIDVDEVGARISTGTPAAILAAIRSTRSSPAEHGSTPASSAPATATKSTAAIGRRLTTSQPNSTAISRKSSRKSHDRFPISSSTAASRHSRPFAHTRSAATRSSKHVVCRGFLRRDPG